MTQTPEFETFSQMLDAEDALQGLDLTEDQKLLVDLREVLREDTERVSLPDGFAEETARLVNSRYQDLSSTDKLLDQSRVHLMDSLFRPSGLAKGLGLAAVGAGLAAASFKALAAYGGILLVFSLLWLALEKKNGTLEFGDGSPVKSSAQRFAGVLFYSLPILAVGTTALLAAGMVGLLGKFSISFRGFDPGMRLSLQVLVALGTAVLLFKACLPYWRAYRARAATQPGRLVYFQFLHAAWITGLFLLVGANSATRDELAQMQFGQATLLVLVFITSLCLAAVVLTHRYSEPVLDPPDFGPARRTLVSSLVFGLLPILAALFAFYQMHLTREIKDPSYEYRLKDVNAWYAAQQEIPAEQNGYLELRPFLIMTEQDKPKNAVVANGFRSLGEFHEDGANSYKNLSPAKRASFQEKKPEFLAQLPKIETALSKTRFSAVAVEGFSYQSLAPNFITYRAVSQGLSLLTQEALEKGDTQAALDYALLGLKWAGREESDTLIREMIKIAQLRITLSDLEAPLAEGRFTRAQLEKLSAELRDALPRQHEFAYVMNRETVMADKAFQQFLIDGEVSWQELDNMGIPPIMSLLPASYWESERKAYWNLQLGQSSGWHSLSNPQFDLDDTMNPMNVGAGSLTPNTGRAMIQYCSLRSQMSALIVMCELEEYKLVHGQYPANLEFLSKQAAHAEDDVTRDAMDTRAGMKKAPFQYKLTDKGYLLVSESPWYDKIQQKSPRIYGSREQ
ncbi:MAG: hypothetical protein KC800_22970 [Candidatus Eremiobacteraeota bacterium]|nr:hypothetical protein [Candidatus Eremiobacteraeota bacterium]